MITMSKFGNHGRLCNQLFQYISLKGIAHKHNTKLALPKWHYAPYFTHSPAVHDNRGQVVKMEETTPCYQEFDIQEGLVNDITGYFQDETYFVDTPETFNFKPEYKKQVRDKFPEVFTKETIAIFIRRTDYENNPVYYQLPITYYINAIRNFKGWRDKNLVFISDDLQYCKNHFQCLPNAIFPNTGDVEQLCLASQCDNFILANSTFGWWAAWFANKGRVTQPNKLYTGKLLEQYGDINFYSKRWETYHNEGKIDLKDVTFTIPVQWDHKDREENLSLCICLLQKYFDTNIIVGENKGNHFSSLASYIRYIQYQFPDFHRTRMLNQMAEVSETKYVANWDADVMVTPMQLLETVEKLRWGSDMVYPYSLIFNRVERSNMKRVYPSYDLGVFKERKGTPSFGGAVLWNRQKFFEAGGENEYFVSYGPEDVERYERAKRLEYQIDRTKGDLIHFDHWKGIDSKNANPNFRRSTEELNKQRKFNKEQQLEYIRSWPWFKPYSSQFYYEISEDAIRSAKEVYKTLLDIGVIKKDDYVFDVGCGVGEWGHDIKELGLFYTGMDYQIPKDKLLISETKYIEHDLRKQYHINPTGSKYELVLCLEVAEHLEEKYADTLINTLCSLGDTILFSAAIPGQGGVNHVNCQWQSYWAKKFIERGFSPSKEVRERIKDNKNICNWYRNNIVIYKKHKYEWPFPKDILLSKAGEYDYVNIEMYKSCMRLG